MKTLYNFERKKEFLVCVDSDGCAMDTMDCKHIHCFGPCMVEEWGLQKWEEPILKMWNDINLYTMTRGINRFKGLAMALKKIDSLYCPIDGVDAFAAWTEVAPELSNNSVREAALVESGSCFVKALSWSVKVNSFALRNLVLKGFSLLFQYRLHHLAFDDLGVQNSIYFLFILFDWCCHEGNNRGFTLCRRQGNDAVGVQRFRPVGLSPDTVFTLQADGKGCQRGYRCHVHRSLGGFRHRFDIVTNHRRQRVCWKLREVKVIEGNGCFPLKGTSTVVSLGRNIAGSAAQLLEEFLTASPDGFQLRIFQGRIAFFCLPEESFPIPGFETLNALSDLFERRLDYIMGRSDDATPTTQNEDDLEDLALSQVEADLTEYALKYARLDQYGRSAVEAIIRAEYNRCRCENTLCPATAYSGHITIKREEVSE